MGLAADHDFGCSAGAALRVDHERAGAEALRSLRISRSAITQITRFSSLSRARVLSRSAAYDSSSRGGEQEEREQEIDCVVCRAEPRTKESQQPWEKNEFYGGGDTARTRTSTRLNSLCWAL